MRLLILFWVAGLLHVSAATFSQTVTLQGKAVPLAEVFDSLRKQTGYSVFGFQSAFQGTRPVTVDAQDMPLEKFLNLVLEGQPLTAEVKDDAIVLSRRKSSWILRARSAESGPDTEISLVFAYPEVRGRVVDSLGNPLIGASVRVLDAAGRRTSLQTSTDRDGKFLLRDVPDDTSLEITYVGYLPQIIAAGTYVGDLVLRAVQSDLEEVEVMMNTGYQQIPKERATGSFEIIDNDEVSRDFATQNIIHRLEGLSPALVFDRRSAIMSESPNQRLSLRFRGPSTIRSDDQPLIIVDNFPFEGDINDINPNDVENLTLLKDGAAAAIWGAKAGNGVIVIQLKSGKGLSRNRIDVSFSGKITNKPNFFESPRFIDPQEYIQLEKEMFDRGQYRNLPASILSPVVDLLFQKEGGEITASALEHRLAWYGEQDFRREAEKYLYRQGNDKNAFISLSGGQNSYNYRVSLGYDHANSVLAGASTGRLTLRSNNEWKLSDKMDLQLGFDYAQGEQQNNSVSSFDASGLVPSGMGMIYPYFAFIDEDERQIGIAKTVNPFYNRDFYKEVGRDWLFYPLQERELRDNRDVTHSYRLSSGIHYRPFREIKLALLYNFNTANDHSISFHNEEAFFARSLINQFVSPTGAFVIPNGNIHHRSNNASVKHAIRPQVDYSTSAWNNQLHISGLIGAEVSQLVRQYNPVQILYDFNPDTYLGNNYLNFIDYYSIRPQSSMRIPQSDSRISENLDRFLSYYTLAAFSWQDKYRLSTSFRWDASNLFGVKTNQKGVPLWSLGGSWSVHNESFWSNGVINHLKIRTTYGKSGNVNKNSSTYPTAVFSTSSRTRLPETMIRTAGNPQLKWETVSTMNLGVDFGLFNNRLTGSVEYYIKNSSDLLGDRVLDPTTGIKPGLGVQAVSNYGTMRTHGQDFLLNLSVLQSRTVRWNLVANTSYVNNEILDYSTDILSGAISYFSYPTPAIAGNSRDILYAFPWYGLDPQGGSPLMMNGDELGTTYGSYVTNYDYENLVKVGNSIPAWSGSFRSNISAYDLTLDVMFLWKGRYYFRRETIGYSSLIERGEMHRDYELRWREPGDEKHTIVPSIPTVLDRNREIYYRNSEALIQRGDHIRLKHIQLSYNLRLLQEIPVTVLFMVENLGLVWKKNEYGIDPEFHMQYYNPPRQFSIGVQVTLN